MRKLTNSCQKYLEDEFRSDYYYETMNSNNRVSAFFIQLGLLGMAIIGVLVRLIIDVISMLASSARTSDPDGTSDVAPSGGVLNYRTGKLDDGMDPIGWYEKD
jgi:hypothetical protein